MAAPSGFFLLCEDYEPRLNISRSLLHPPDLPREPLSALHVLRGCGVKLPLVVGYVGRQLGALPLKRLPLVKGPRHAGQTTMAFHEETSGASAGPS